MLKRKKKILCVTTKTTFHRINEANVRAKKSFLNMINILFLLFSPTNKIVLYFTPKDGLEKKIE